MSSANLHLLPELAKNNKKSDLNHAIHKGGDVNQQDSVGQTALYNACCNNHLDIIKILLENDSVNVNLQKCYGETPLFVACTNGHLQAVSLLLLDPRVDVNLPNDDGWTPLMNCCFWGHTELVKAILASYKSVVLTKTSIDGRNAADLAKQKGNNAISAIIEEYKKNPVETSKKLRADLGLKDLSDKEKLVLACGDNNMTEFKNLLASVKDVNCTDQHGHSLMWLACYRNNIEIVKYLLTDPNFKEDKIKLCERMTQIFKAQNQATETFSSQYFVDNRALHLQLLSYIDRKDLVIKNKATSLESEQKDIKNRVSMMQTEQQQLKSKVLSYEEKTKKGDAKLKKRMAAIEAEQKEIKSKIIEVEAEQKEIKSMIQRIEDESRKRDAEMKNTLSLILTHLKIEK